MRLNVTLAAGDYKLVRLSKEQGTHVGARSDVDLSVEDGKMVAKVFDNAVHTVELATGPSVQVQADVLDEMVLGNWSIAAKAWGKFAVLSIHAQGSLAS